MARSRSRCGVKYDESFLLGLPDEQIAVFDCSEYQIGLDDSVKL